MARLTRRTFLGAVGLLPLSWRAVIRWLSAPTLSATVSGSDVMLGWTDAGDETNYIIFRGTSSTNLVQIATVPANTLTYRDVGVLA